MRDSFQNLADYLVAVATAADAPSRADPRLAGTWTPRPSFHAAASGANEAVPSDGGFAVPDEFMADLWNATYDSGRLLALCDVLPMKSSTLKVPGIGETTRADGSRFGGLTMDWLTPGAELPAGKPKWRRVELTARRLAGVTHVTDELWQDAPALEATFRRLYGLESAHRIEQEILDGEGTRGPLGILNSEACLTVAAESGQTTGTVTAGNVGAMWSRMWEPSRRRAVWLVNGDVEEQLLAAKLATGSALAHLVGFNSEGLTLCGRPVIPTEYNPTLGSRGDIVLADLSQYLLGDRSAMAETSIHLRFIHGESAFRFSVRVDGSPAWFSPVTPKNSALTRSPFVTLEARA